MNAWGVWLAAGLMLAGLEMMAPGVYLLWVGVAAVATGGITLLLGLEVIWQLAAFIAFTAAAVGIVALRLQRRPLKDVVNAPSAGLLGQVCRALEFRDGEGRVAFGDGTWAARVTDGTVPANGQALRIVGLDGTTLLVSDPATPP